MRGGVIMFRGVAVRRRVATADMSAGEAEPQMNPGRTDLQTVLTPICAGNDVVSNLVQVGAVFAHHLSAARLVQPHQTLLLAVCRLLAKLIRDWLHVHIYPD
jgi:hypothetical protein